MLYALALVTCELLSGQPDLGAVPRSFGATVRRHLERGLAFEPAQRPEAQDWANRAADLIETRAAWNRRRTVVVAGTWIAAFGVAISMLWWSRSAARSAGAATPRSTIVLGDFVNSTGEAVFDETLKQGLSVTLTQSPFLSIVPEESVRETLKLMGQAGAPLTPERAREVCVRTNTAAVLTGSISRLGSHYVIGLRGQDCRSGTDLANHQVEAARMEDVLKALDTASSVVRRALGESMSSVAKFAVPLEQATTPSLEAFQAYSMGVARFLESGDEASIVYFKRAVELDPGFALVYITLGASYANVDQMALSTESFERAYALKDRTSAREQLRITAEYLVFVTGEIERANVVYQQWAREYPSDYKAFGRLARNRMLIGQLEQAVAPSREALRLFPGAASHSFNLINLYLALNRPRDAQDVYERAIKENPDHTRLHARRYSIAFFDNDVAEMRRQMELSAGRPDYEEWRLANIADLEAHAGRFRQFRRLLQQAAALEQQHNGLEAAAPDLVDGALAEADAGNVREARALAERGVKMTADPEVQAMAALALARSGERAQATKLADSLAQSRPRDTLQQGFWLPTIRAAIALGQGDAARAIELLDGAAKFERSITYTFGGSLYPAYVRGEAYLKAGRATDAQREFQKVIAARGLVGNSIHGVIAHLHLARAQMLAGDRDAARESYDRFVNLWKDADGDVPVLKVALRERALLK